MSQKFLYPTVVEALSIHSVLIKMYGGSSGLRDGGLLEAALFRPQTGYYKDIVEEAAALMESLATSHCFIDGNKRVAFAVTDVFLRINGFQLLASSSEIYKKMIGFFESGKFEFAEIEPYLRSIVVESRKN